MTARRLAAWLLWGVSAGVGRSVGRTARAFLALPRPAAARGRGAGEGGLFWFTVALVLAGLLLGSVQHDAPWVLTELGLPYPERIPRFDPAQLLPCERLTGGGVG